MRSKTYLFDCAEHEEFGTPGWKMHGNHNADPLSGMAVAHDILEHSLNGDMGVEDELMALGASFHVRQYTRNMHSLGTNVGADLPEILRHVWNEGMSLRDPGRTLPIAVEHEIEDALHALQSERQYDQDLDRKLDTETIRRMRGWMRRGYRSALARYKGVPNWALPNVFEEIEHEADRLLKCAEIGFSQLAVTVTYRRALLHDQRRIETRIRLIERYEEEY